MSQADDQQLLTEFATGRDQEAFRELVSRYVDLVYSVALRLVVDTHLAEDVGQQVFAELAKQAQSVRRKIASGAALSGWLHVTTRNLAAKTVRTEMRRRAREQEAFVMRNLESDSTVSWMEVARELDSALAQLREDDRDLLLQRFFERKTAREIAEKRNVTEEAAQKRLSRALDRLRQVLAARGVSVSGSAFAGILTANCVQAAPVAFASTVASGALALSAAVGPIGFLASASQLLSPLVMTKTQFAGVVALIAVIGTPLGIQHHTLTQLRDGEGVEAPIESSFIHQPSASLSQNRSGGEGELDRLRRRAAALRAEIQRKKSQASSLRAQQLTSPASLVMLAPGREAVSIADLTFAGIATPEAALQTLFYYSREGDVDGVSTVSLISPDEVEEWHEMLQSPEMRVTLATHMKLATRGATEISEAQLDEAGVVTSQREGLVDPGEQATVRLLGKAQLDERRVQLKFEVGAGKSLKVDSLSFGLTSSGWKQIP